MKKVSDPPDDPFSASMRARSGTIDSSSLLDAFLYLLMRDHITPGTVEYMMIQLEKERWHIEPKTVMEFTNGWLAKNSMDVADRLLGRIPLNKKPLPPQNDDKETFLTLPISEDERY